MIRSVRTLALAVAAAAVIHAIAGHHLAAVDPIARLVAGRRADIAVAAIWTALARLFLFFVAPGWAVTIVGRALARGAVYVPPK